MTRGIGKNTPVKSVTIDDFAEVNIKLTKDDLEKYYYMIQPLFEFTSNYGISLATLITLNTTYETTSSVAQQKNKHLMLLLHIKKR